MYKKLLFCFGLGFGGCFVWGGGAGCLEGFLGFVGFGVFCLFVVFFSKAYRY